MTQTPDTVAELIGSSFDEKYLDFDLTEIKAVLEHLSSSSLINLGEAEFLQQRALYGADKLSDYLGKLIKLISYYEGKINSVKNKVSLSYEAPQGRTTAELRKQAGECAPEVDQLQEELAKLRGARSALEKKYDILIKFHHLCKDLASKYRGGGHLPIPIIPADEEKMANKKVPGWE